MFKRILLYTCFISLVLATGCKKLDDINHDPTKSTSAQPAFLLTGAEKNAMDMLNANLQNGYIAMMYAQYWTGNTRVTDAQYTLDQGNNTAFWNTLYGSLHSLNQIVQLNNANSKNAGAVNQNAIANILKVWLFQILTDTYTNIPYTDALKEDQNITPKYDAQADIYASLVDTLQAQIALLDPAKPTFDNGDVIYNGDVTKWTKLAHSLLLRLAIRMADVDPAKAQQIIQDNYQAAMTSNADNAQFTYIDADPNKYPNNESERAIVDFFVTSTLVDYMKSVNDPRLPIYARLPVDSNVIVGMPYGQLSTDPARKPPGSYSLPGTKMYSSTMPGALMNYSEVEFILAEAAARSWSVGDAATHYENGIKASMDYWGVTTGVDEYIAGVPYNQADWRNVIGTQKWLSLYPQGFQAWFERIRLDFKKPGGADLFIAPVSGSLDPSAPFVPYRLTYPQGEQTSNKTAYDAAAAAIGGDTKGTKNWWDKL
jgi:hypothetical protein